MVAFGYIPRENVIKDLFFRLIGFPNFVRRLQAPVLLSMLDLRQDNVVLDLGCGSGWFSCEMARRCKNVVAVDITLPKVGLLYRKIPNLRFIKCDGQSMPFSNDKFDRILLSSVLQMVSNDRVLIDEVRRSLKLKGKVVLSVPVGYTYFKRLYGRGLVSRLFLRFLVKLFRFPDSYEDLKEKFNKKFGVKGKGYYTIEEVRRLFESSGFKLEDSEYTPKKFASLIFELWLAFSLILNINPSSKLLFIFFPFCFFEKFIPKHTIGDEVVMRFSLL